MNNFKVRILFYVLKNKANKKGECSIMCRITLNKKRKEFSTGLFTIPNHWDSKKQKLLSKAELDKLL